MKVSTKRPKIIKMPVEVEEGKYELWYAEPVLLGTVEKDGPLWFTDDGIKFLSSRDALEHLLKVYLGRQAQKEIVFEAWSNRPKAVEQKLAEYKPAPQRPAPAPVNKAIELRQKKRAQKQMAVTSAPYMEAAAIQQLSAAVAKDPNLLKLILQQAQAMNKKKPGDDIGDK